MATKSLSQRKIRENHLKAMGHELRYDIWSILLEREASPKELAEHLGANLSNVSHHTKQLVNFGCAELVDKRQVRGAIEHFYKGIRRTLIDDSDWTLLLEKDPRLAEYAFARNTQEMFDDITEATKAGVFVADDRFLVDRTKVVVDAQGCDELLALFDRVEDQEVVNIVRRSAERRAESGGEPINMSVNLAILKTATR